MLASSLLSMTAKAGIPVSPNTNNLPRSVQSKSGVLWILPTDSGKFIKENELTVLWLTVVLKYSLSKLQDSCMKHELPNFTLYISM